MLSPLTIYIPFTMSTTVRFSTASFSKDATRKLYSVVGILLAFPSPIQVAKGKPFGTINGLGQHKEHEIVTRLAFQCPPGQRSNGDCFEPITLDNIAGTHVGGIPGIGHNGMDGSLDDLLPEGPELHCHDAGYFFGTGYPRMRAQANDRASAVLTTYGCDLDRVFVDQLMLNGNDRIIAGMTELESNKCDHRYPQMGALS
jgi:hypothetical protein